MTNYPQAPQFASQPPGGKQRLRGRIPRILGFIFLALAIIGFVIGGVIGKSKSYDAVNDFHRIPVSGGSVTLDGTGTWVVYYEASNVDDIDTIPIEVQVTGPSGAVKVEPYGNRSDGKVEKFTYDFNGHHGIAVEQFTANAKGAYQVEVQTDGSAQSGAKVAVGRDIVASTLAAGAGIGLGVLFLIVAIILLIIGFVKRSNNKKELRASASGGHGGTPPGYGFPQQGGYPQPGQGGYPQQGGPGGYQPPPGQGGYPPNS